MDRAAIKALTAAVARGDLDAAQDLLDDDPELATDWQPVMTAAFHGRPESVELLLERGADPNVLSSTNHRHRPLHRVIEHKQSIPKHEGHDAVIEVLLTGGADPNLRGTWMDLPALELAYVGRETRFAAPLLAHGANDTIYAAAARADADRVQELVEADVLLARRADDNGWDALQYLCAVEADPSDAEARMRVAERLLDGGADPVEAVGWAAYAGHTAIIRMILDRGGPPPDAHGLTHAAENGFTDILKLAKQHGADLNDNTGNEHHGGYGPLGSMLKMKRSKGLAWLLENGADPNRIYNDTGQTALHIAVTAGCNPKVIQTLLAHGADPRVRDAAGRTALEYAEEMGKVKQAEALAKATV